MSLSAMEAVRLSETLHVYATLDINHICYYPMHATMARTAHEDWHKDTYGLISIPLIYMIAGQTFPKRQNRQA